MEIMPVKYMFELIRKGDTIPPTLTAKIQSLLEMFGYLTEKVRQTTHSSKPDHVKRQQQQQ